jgi:hypothetical protein
VGGGEAARNIEKGEEFAEMLREGKRRLGKK